MSYSHVRSPEPNNNNSSNSSGAFKTYQFFVFCVPVFFAFILLFVFYLFYLRPRRVNWSSLRMRTAPPPNYDINDDIPVLQSGLKKEYREMLPIVVYNESFFVRDSQCAVCLGDYQADDRLHQVPACGHTFHIDCIDSWLSMHTTCPLCRLSLLSSHKSQNESPDVTLELSHTSSVAENDVLSISKTLEACKETEASQFSGLRNGEPSTFQNCSEGDASGCQCADPVREYRDARIGNEVHDHTGDLLPNRLTPPSFSH